MSTHMGCELWVACKGCRIRKCRKSEWIYSFYFLSGKWCTI